MSTMLSDKVEEVGGGVGAAGGLGGNPPVGVRPAAAHLREELRHWKEDVLSAIETRLSAADVAPQGRVGSHEGRDPDSQTLVALQGVREAVYADVQMYLRQVEAYVRDHPLKAAGIATGAGFLFGVWWSR